MNINLQGFNLKKILYPLTSGLMISYLSTAIIGVVYYKNEIPSFKTGMNKQISATNKDNDISIKEIEERNIFKTKMIAVSQNNSQDILQGYNLIGIFHGDQRPAAFIEDRNKVVKIIRQGQMLDGFKLIKVNFEGVELLKDNQKQSLKFPIPQTNPSTASASKPNPDNSIEKANNMDNISISKEEVMSETQDSNKLLTSIVIGPYYNNSNFIGFKFNVLKDNSLFYKIGLRQGDIIKKINGIEIKSPEQAMELFLKIKELTAVNIDIVRNEEKKSLFIDIKQ
ncbi:MAG: hypothetical protein HQK91_13990 [Nitrospirae bacterium]|nr:hypothetical protein [Nitrospirota bacterium]